MLYIRLAVILILYFEHVLRKSVPDWSWKYNNKKTDTHTFIHMNAVYGSRSTWPLEYNNPNLMRLSFKPWCTSTPHTHTHTVKCMRLIQFVSHMNRIYLRNKTQLTGRSQCVSFHRSEMKLLINLNEDKEKQRTT